MNLNHKRLLLFLFLSLATAPRLDAANVLLSWTPNTEPDLAGYKVFYRTGSASYGPPTNVGKVSSHTVTGLSSGTYFFALKAYDTSQNESAFSTEVSLVIAAVPPPTGGTGTGLTGAYFNNINLTGSPVLTRVDPMVDFSWPTSPGSGVTSDNFSVRWTGQIEAPSSGNYTFQTQSDDGVRVWLTTGSETLIIQNWTTHAPTLNTSSSISLTANTKYVIRMESFEGSQGATSRLRWKVPGSTSFVTIPMTALYPTGGTTPVLPGPAITITGPAGRQLTITRRTDNASTALPLTVNLDDCVKYNGVKLAGGANCP